VPKIPGINHLDAVRALQKAGFRIVRQSKHIVMSDGVRIVTIPRNNPVNAFTMGGIAQRYPSPAPRACVVAHRTRGSRTRPGLHAVARCADLLVGNILLCIGCNSSYYWNLATPDCLALLMGLISELSETTRYEESNSNVTRHITLLMKRDYYSSSIEHFLDASSEEIIGALTINRGFAIETTQRDAWLEEITILKTALRDFNGQIYFEYSIPRMGRRNDVVLLIASALFVLEFKIGERQFASHAINQADDYGLDLKNFHETSRDLFIAGI